MKINIKTSIIGSTLAAMLAFCGTAQAQTSFSVFSWGIGPYGSGGGWTVTGNNGNGDFTVGGSTLTSGASWVAAFPTVTLDSFQYIELTGTFDITGSVGGTGPLRFGIYNEGNTIGTLSSGVWSGGSTGWTGYTVVPPTGAGYASGGEFFGHDHNSWASTYSGYAFGTGDPLTDGTTNGIRNDTYTFDIKLTQFSTTPGSTYVRMETSLVGSTNAPIYSINNIGTGNDDIGGAASANNLYDAVGFYLANNGTSATQLSFHNVTITTTGTAVPEPVSMALLGSGLLGLLMVRRFRK